MKLRINKIENTKKVKLVKSCTLVGLMIPTLFAGCNAVDFSSYYLVHNDGNYYICTRLDKYINSCDFEYKSIVDGKIVGVVCDNNNSFDYQMHRLSTEFLCELQICNLKDVLNTDSVNLDNLKALALSDEINEIGDKYFQNKKYFYDYNNTSLQIYRTNNKAFFGYDLSPERLSGSCNYVYSIIDNDVINLSDSDVDIYDVGNYFYKDNYVVYDTVQSFSEHKNLVKLIEK